MDFEVEEVSGGEAFGGLDSLEVGDGVSSDELDFSVEVGDEAGDGTDVDSFFLRPMFGLDAFSASGRRRATLQSDQ